MLSIEESKSKVMNIAIQLYRDEKIGLSKAAEIAGLSIAEFENQLIKKRVGVTLYTKDDLPLFKSEIEKIRDIAKKSKEALNLKRAKPKHQHQSHSLPS